MADFQLTPPPSGPDQPGARITDWREMEGKTVRCVIGDPGGKFSSDCDAVIVFEDDCWATLIARSNGSCEDDGASVILTNRYGGKPELPTDYLSPRELLQAGLVNQAQCQHLLEQQKAADAADRAARAARLRKQAEDLERGKAL